ncbi:phosphotransferase [Planococcus shixiaomingii]|uniref:phosphotransferase n=1 Tax=Planococcus shixiaomingii TaxID=3058393 RepID=UPI0026137E36|nr:phosphotransferase [Planococcus sp. N022]WKA55982.1 phosphotransferase [Planococcus sp. N022]
MKASLQTEIEKVVGKIIAVEVLGEQGCTSEVCKLETAQGSFLLKRSFEKRYRMWLAEEAKVLKKLMQEKGIPVPQYYGFIEESDSSSLIMSFENGMTLTAALTAAESIAEKKVLIKSFGEFLHKFHEQEPLRMLDEESDWLERQFGKAQSYVDNGETEGSQELLNHLKAHKPFSVKQTMIHGDCTTDNVFVQDGEVRLFIDVAGMTIGDLRYDISLAISDFIDSPELLDAFYDGYTRYRVSPEEIQYFDGGLYEFF